MYRPLFTYRILTVLAAAALATCLAGQAAGQPNSTDATQQKPGEARRDDDRGQSARGPAKWWEAYRAELRLTPDQATRIDAIFETTFPQLRASYGELSRREEQLSASISANDATEAEVLRQADQIESIRGELNKTRVLMLFRMRRVLSPEQRDKLQVLRKDRDRDRGAPPSKR